MFGLGSGFRTSGLGVQDFGFRVWGSACICVCVCASVWKSYISYRLPTGPSTNSVYILTAKVSSVLVFRAFGNMPPQIINWVLDRGL